MCGASRRSSRAHSAWNVEIHIARQSMSEQRLDALAHLLGRLVGEGDGEDLVRTRESLGDQIGDAMRDDARLARARAGEDQQRRLRCDEPPSCCSGLREERRSNLPILP